jgi:stage IV sporulation protein FB
MLAEPPETAWDLRWQMFGVPVRVHPFFWLVMLLLGQSAFRQGPIYLVIWVLCAFVSILIHEFGHVFMGMVFGARGHIVLYAFGGLAIGSNRLARPYERIAVSLAGPFAQFGFLAVILGMLFLRDTQDAAYVSRATEILGLPHLALEHDFRLTELSANRPIEFAIVSTFIAINIFWPLLNLLPIWPLDGGQVTRELCDLAHRGRGLSLSLLISTTVAGAIAGVALLAYLGRPMVPFIGGSPWMIIMFGLLAYQSYQAYVAAESHRRWTDDHWQ